MYESFDYFFDFFFLNLYISLNIFSGLLSIFVKIISLSKHKCIIFLSFYLCLLSHV